MWGIMTRSVTEVTAKGTRTRRLWLESLEDRVTPAYTATLAGTTATFTGNGASDALNFSTFLGFLRHNRAGDPGFASTFDFNTAVAGNQLLAEGGGTVVNVNAGG